MPKIARGNSICVRRIIEKFFFVFISGLFFVFYLAMGASIFSAIESPIEKDEMNRLRQKKQDFLQKYDCITGISKIITG